MTAGTRAVVRAVVLLSLLLAVIAGCAGATENRSAEGEPGAGTVVSDSAPADLDPLLTRAASWSRTMTYRSRSGVDDDNTHVTGSVFAPKGSPPAGGFPVVALAPPVVGSAPDCAASLSPDLSGSATTVVALLQAGFVVFVPDYQGLGVPSDGETTYHPYLDSTTAGYVVIDGVRAAKALVPVPTSRAWAALGSAEGGQAVWAANELVENYGSGLNLIATASLAPVSDFEGLADAAMAGTLSPEQKLVYVGYLAAMKSAHEYDVDLADYRRGLAERNWDALMSCTNGHRLDLARQIPAEDLRPVDDRAMSALRGYLRKTTLPQGPTAAPMYVIHGGRDAVTPAAWTERALTRACRVGDVVQIAFWPGAGHRIEPVAAVGWLTDRMHGNPSANDCPSYLAAHGRPPAAPDERTETGRGAAAPMRDADTDMSTSPGPANPGVSLTTGWLPAVVELVTLGVLASAVGRRAPRWLLHWIPGALMVGFALAAAVRLFVTYQGWTERAASWQAVFWTAATGFAVAIAVLGWRGIPWWRRCLSVLAVILGVLTAALALNSATGYFPSVGSLWRQATGATPEDWIDESALGQLLNDGVQPVEGTMVWLDIHNAASGFDHRPELVYLPPAWFGSDPPPRLPVVMMLGGEFSQPSDWPVSADAVATLDRFAAVHRGYTPIFVFPDTTGSFSNDTECVNGPRGAAADHLVKDVVPYVGSKFGASTDPAGWGLVGWSSGGTCALMTAVMHPDKFGAFVDLDGQLGPNTGTKRQTVARLFGGDDQAWASFDPRTVIEKHGRYDGLAAWLGVSDEIPTEHRPAGQAPPAPEELGEWDPYSEEHADNARRLCLLLSGHGGECAVVGYGGAHDFQSAGAAFAEALPWLAARLGTPEAPARALPGAP